MAPSTEQLARCAEKQTPRPWRRADDGAASRAQAVEKELLRRAAADRPSGADLAPLLQEYRTACEDAIFADFEHAAGKQLEAQLWAAHTKVNNIFRHELKESRRNANKTRVVENRKLTKSYLQFIKASQRFYRHYVLSLDKQFGGISEMRKIAQEWKDDASKAPPHKRIPASLKKEVLHSCYKALINLGDLSRYRETELGDKTRNWGPAKGYYDLATDIYPDSGMSHNQLAVIAREDGNHFRVTYHFYRSLASKEPHPLARQNLELEFGKVCRAWDKGELINNHPSPDGNAAGRALVAWFIRLHSKCYKGEEFSQHDELESEVLSQLAILIKERPLDTILHKIILINLSAEYFATVQMQLDTPPDNIMRTYFYYLRLNVKTFFTLLQVLQLELERISEGDDVTHNGDHPRQLSDKITAVARRTLPGLRLYSTWFARYWHVLNANIAETLTSVEVRELWKAYAATLTLLTSSFPSNQLPTDDYMLEEDTDTIGFEPLVSPYTKEDSPMKKRWTDGQVRNHPNIEMLMRVRDLLLQGVYLTLNPDAPLDLDQYRFIYREEGLPSELLASPNNHTEGSPVIPPEAVNFPLFPPDAPIPDDQKSHSVAAGSESASTVLAKDSAMNRMVDDLVGPDEGLEPLPEEDENIPPTPPAQTFEDTALVTDSTYGLGSVTINDIVNSMHNYTKPVGSPSPIAVAFSTPMNRVASSSSIRQPVNLPSLPDGQMNSASIWNRNHSGTSGPNSPLFWNGNEARESPLNGVRSAGLSGHVRGDSSQSTRSIDCTFPGASSGGLGSGTAWGIPSAPGAVSYGAAFDYNQGANLLNLGYASPTYLSSVNGDRRRSSYARTPPNGQVG
ncbi:hypothetical protein BDV95DRAFT_488515 [Massariosphaeria phaeospora]|uniref:Protein SMG7 n=1 Tax=Massariosphaeria phaeospora TaxID=100035 RepID=A0A7C8IJ46_9PLEO|nr:hypothetical protein BDV95DRAFT_488515 [Massariosphaeria phaeospora]